MKISTFQLAVLGIFSLFILVGVGSFAVFNGSSSASVGTVIVWGTLDQSAVDNILADLRQGDKSFQGVQYVQKKSSAYADALLNGMASGSGPDLFLVSQEQVSQFADKILPVPYSAVSQGTFVSSYIDEGQLFLTPQGPLGLPFVVDPMALYWNKNLFAAADVAQPPAHWNDLLALAPKLTKLGAGQSIAQSAAPLGGWGNVANAKATLAILTMQAGDPIVARGADGRPQAAFGLQASNAAENPAASALRFYTDFANPVKQVYSWNSALPDASAAFSSGELAMYFGFASEYRAIAARNPNLSFAVAPLPQLQSGAVMTYGTLAAFAISRAAKNPAGALTVAEKLTAAGAATAVAARGFIPARRDVSLDTSGSAAYAVFVQSALVARGWLDPAPTQTGYIFQQMVQSVMSGAAEPTGAVGEASQRLQALVPN